MATVLPLCFVILGLLAISAEGIFLTCDFEEDFCGYEPNQFFVRYTRKSPSLSSGPVADHTTGEEGYYALCDARLLRNPSDVCTLTKDVLVTETSDLSFWYFMFGSQVGTLELVVDGEPVWNLTGSQEKFWLRAQVQLEQGDHKIEFRANRSEEGRTSADLAIDDITIKSEEVTTKMTTVTRTSPKPLTISGCEFDVTTCNWQTDYVFNRWFQTNGNMSGYFDMLGPASDWTSLSTSVLNNVNQPLNTLCSIPYCTDEDGGRISTHYYCKKFLFRNRPACGRQSCPLTVDNTQLDICNLGNYLLISSDKFSTPSASFRSRLYSPVFQPKPGVQTYCLRYKYNIVTNNPGDGFSIFIDDYYSQEDIFLTSKMGKLPIDRWHSESILLRNVNKFSALRFVIQPFRQDTTLPVDDFASVSIDSIAFLENSCPNDEDSSIVVDLNDIQTTTTTTTTTTTSTRTSTTTTTTTTTTSTTPTPTTETTTTPSTTPATTSTSTTLPSTVSTSERTTSSSASIQTSPSSRTTSSGSTLTSSKNPTTNETPTRTSQAASTTRDSSPTPTTPTTSRTPATTRATSPATSAPASKSTTTLRTATFSVIDNQATPKKKGGNLYVNIFAPIASVLVFSVIVVGLYVVAKKKGITLQSFKRSRSVDAMSGATSSGNRGADANNMELGTQ